MTVYQSCQQSDQDGCTCAPGIQGLAAVDNRKLGPYLALALVASLCTEGPSGLIGLVRGKDLADSDLLPSQQNNKAAAAC